MRRIGLFGGSFDPVHTAHVALARLALSEMQLDEVRWVPAGQPWQKTRQLASPQHREAMVRLAIEGEPRIVLDRCELTRRGPSFTLDTVRELQAAEPGNDAFKAIYQRHLEEGMRDVLAGKKVMHQSLLDATPSMTRLDEELQRVEAAGAPRRITARALTLIAMTSGLALVLALVALAISLLR